MFRGDYQPGVPTDRVRSTSDRCVLDYLKAVRPGEGSETCVGSLRAVIDRVEGGLAVLLVGDDEVQLDLPLTCLPAGVQEGSILTINFEEDRVETLDVRETMQRRIDRLRRRGKE